MELQSWSPDFGLPTWHQRCLAMQTYAKFTGAPVSVAASDNPFWTPEGDLPVFRHGKVQIVDFEEFVRYLEERKFSADFRLTARQRAENLAFRKMLEDQLAPALALAFYVNGRNNVEVTRPWFAKRLPFPLAFVYPGRYFGRAEALVQCAVSSGDGGASSLSSTAAEEPDFAVVEKAVLDRAEECLRSVSLRLGDGPFLHGGTPSSLDALVFSYVAPIIKVKLPDNHLSDRAEKYPNLSQFVSRVISSYFPATANAHDQQRKKTEDESDSTSTSANTGVAKTDRSVVNNLFSLAVAVAAMTGYAFSSGLVNALQGGRRRRAKAAVALDEDE